MPAKFNLLSYLGGFFDGEGCIYIAKHKRGNQHCYQLNASVSQNNKFILNTFQGLFGGKVYKNSNKHEGYCWMIHAAKAGNFLKDIEPYLITKAGEARLGLTFQKFKWGRTAGQRRTEGERAIEEAQYILMKGMKNHVSS